MALMGLPNEMLQLVGSFLVEEADIYAFILTHSRMYGLLIDQLYRNAVQRKDPRRPAVLFWASANNRLETARKALTSGADINEITNEGYTALWVAADKGHTEIVRLLLAVPEVDVTIESHLGYCRWNALHIACWKQRLGAIKLMLDSDKFDANAHCSTGGTPLQKACQNGHAKTVRALLASGKVRLTHQPLNEHDPSRSPFDAAVYKGNAKIAHMLLDAGLDLTGNNADGSTPLHIAAIKPVMSSVVKRLIAEEGVEVNVRNAKGETPLHKACAGLFSGNEEIVQILLAMPGIDSDVRTTDGKTPLDYALASGEADIERLLSAFKAKRRRVRYQ